MATKKVVVFGSCNLDMFFNVSNMNFFVDTGAGAQDSMHFETHAQAPGGKGANQAVAASKAGAKVHFYGAVGSGAHARYLIDNFKKVGINTSGIQQLSLPTGLAIIFNKPDGSHKMINSDGANMKAKSAMVPDRLLNKDTFVVLQTETDLKENSKLLRRAKKLGAKIVYNVAPAAALSVTDLKNIDFLIVNKPEAEVIAGGAGMDASNLPQFAKEMAKKFKMMCIVTLGEKGVMAAVPGMDETILAPSLPVKAIDTVGAGDAFVGGFVAAMAEGIDPLIALNYGAVAGSLACTRVGAQSALPSANEIRHAVKKLLPQKASKKKPAAKKKVSKK